MINKSLQDKLAGLIEKSQQTKKVKSLYQDNLNLLKLHAPNLIKKLENHQSSRFILKTDSNNQTNLLDVKNNTFIYDKSPTDVAKSQCDVFLKTSKACGITPVKETNNWAIEPKFINKLIDIYEKQNKSIDNFDYISLLIMSGIGLGYQMINLIKEKSIYHLCLVDSNLDCLQASLKTIDWQPIFEYFQKPNRSLTFAINKEVDNNIETISQLINQQGLFLGANTHIFCHINGGKYQQFVDVLSNKYSYFFNQQGFFEDEQIALAHSIKNINECDGIYHQKFIDSELPPCLIIGNGPSLDDSIPFIKENQDKFIIFSCGSALEPLLKNNIIPDYQVMLERTLNTEKVARNLSSDLTQKKITLLSTNTIPAKTKNYFNNHYIAFKPMDSGTLLYEQLNQSFSIKALNHCGPLVANTGLSFAIHLGFTKIYLFGVDCGMKSINKHHSKDSSYFKKDNFLGHYREDTINLTHKGNLSESVVTSPLLLTSILNMQLILQSNDTISAYNGSDGALIKGAMPINPKDCSALNFVPLNKKEIKSSIKNTCFTKNFPSINEQYIIGEITDLIDYIETFNGEIITLSKQNVFLKLTNLHQKLNRIAKKKPLSTYLLSGSQHYFFLIILLICQQSQNDEDLSINYQQCLFVYQGFLNFVNIILTNHLSLTLDKSSFVFKQYAPDNEQHNG